MLLRSLALRDEAIALCDEAVVLMLLWKLAPINDIADNDCGQCGVHNCNSVTPTPCAAA